MEIDKGLGALFVSPDELEAINRVNQASEVNTTCTLSRFVIYRGNHYFRVPLELLPQFSGLIDQAVSCDELPGTEPERFRTAAQEAQHYINQMSN